MRKIMFLKREKTIVLEIKKLYGFLLNISVLQGTIKRQIYIFIEGSKSYPSKILCSIIKSIKFIQI